MEMFTQENHCCLKPDCAPKDGACVWVFEFGKNAWTGFPRVALRIEEKWILSFTEDAKAVDVATAWWSREDRRHVYSTSQSCRAPLLRRIYLWDPVSTWSDHYPEASWAHSSRHTRALSAYYADAVKYVGGAQADVKEDGKVEAAAARADV